MEITPELEQELLVLLAYGRLEMDARSIEAARQDDSAAYKAALTAHEQKCNALIQEREDIDVSGDIKLAVRYAEIEIALNALARERAKLDVIHARNAALLAAGMEQALQRTTSISTKLPAYVGALENY